MTLQPLMHPLDLLGARVKLKLTHQMVTLQFPLWVNNYAMVLASLPVSWVVSDTTASVSIHTCRRLMPPGLERLTHVARQPQKR